MLLLGIGERKRQLTENEYETRQRNPRSPSACFQVHLQDGKLLLPSYLMNYSRKCIASPPYLSMP